MEYELLDTGVFDEDRYFDVFVEYAKAGPEDVLVRITVHNRGPEAARLRVLPTLWFRNTWSWGVDDRRPSLRESSPGIVEASAPRPGQRTSCSATAHPTLLFTENESNAERLWNQPNATPYVKDAFHACVVSGQSDAVNPAKTGTKAAAHYALDVPAGGSQHGPLRLTTDAVRRGASSDFDEVFATAAHDADEFYDRITPPSLDEDQRRVHRQALAGMLWGKQFYYFDLEQWLSEHKSHPLLESARPGVRNTDWFHMLNADVISMPDKWEYPWYAAWDLAFHTVSLALVDFDFAKDQLLLMLRSLYFHPNGQIPGVRVELRRREPARARVGDDLSLQDGEVAGPRRPAVPRAVVPGPDAELQLVGQPEGPVGPERVRGRLPGARQHRRVRPQFRTADGRLARAGGRHGVDGVLLPVHARDGPHPQREG